MPNEYDPGVPEEQHVVRVQSVDDSALFLQGQHGDVKFPGVEEVQDHLDDLHLLHIDDLLCCHGNDGLTHTPTTKLRVSIHTINGGSHVDCRKAA